MGQILEEINQLVSPQGTEIQWALLFNSLERDNYICLGSTLKEYTTGKRYLMYDIPPLTRLLLSKAKILDGNLHKNLFPFDNKMCHILTWDDHAKKILIFSDPKAKIETYQSIAQNINDSNEKLGDLFQQAYRENLEKI